VIAFCFVGCSTHQREATYAAIPAGVERLPLTGYQRIATGTAEEAAATYKSLAAAIEVEFLDGPIIPISVALPGYPEELQRQRIYGIVEVAFVVGEDGTVQGAVIERSVHPRLDAECLRAVRKWRFAPMTSGGKPVKVKMLQRFPFVL
jgi:protein TonB